MVRRYHWRRRRPAVASAPVVPGAMAGLMRHMPLQDFVDRSWADGYGRPCDGLPGWKSLAQGAATSAWAAVAPNSRPQRPVPRQLRDRPALEHRRCATDGYHLPYLLDPERAERLWELSEKLTSGHNVSGTGGTPQS